MLEKFDHPPDIIGRVVIGTAYGDLHSLGKRIVMGCLKALMVEATDLGANVSAERFVDEAIARDAQVIAVSAMMVHTAIGDNGARKVRRILKERGLEERIKLIAVSYTHLDVYKRQRSIWVLLISASLSWIVSKADVSQPVTAVTRKGISVLMY